MMKKVIPFLFGIAFAMMCGLLLQSWLCVAAYAMSPFSSDYSTFILMVGLAVVSLAVLIAVLIANIRYLFKVENIKNTIICEIIIFAILVLPFWQLWEVVLDRIIF